jgi:hypothetical protein
MIQNLPCRTRSIPKLCFNECSIREFSKSFWQQSEVEMITQAMSHQCEIREKWRVCLQQGFHFNPAIGLWGLFVCRGWIDLPCIVTNNTEYIRELSISRFSFETPFSLPGNLSNLRTGLNMTSDIPKARVHTNRKASDLYAKVETTSSESKIGRSVARSTFYVFREKT